jgi:hypothetical protein
MDNPAEACGSDGVDARRRHLCDKVEMLKTPLEGGVRDRD